MALKTKALVIKAEDEPKAGIFQPGTHQRYRHPQLEIVTRSLEKVSLGKVRLKIIMAGICGTDVHLLKTDKETGYVLTSAPAYIPPEGRVLGHECVAEVVECGAGVRGIQPGDIVSCESVISCGTCFPCRRGEFNQCSRAELMGLETDGVFSHYADLPQRICHPIGNLADKPNGLRQAACLEPAAVAHVAFEAARFRAADRVIIFGAGPIGLFLAMLGKYIFGASQIDIVEPLELRRNLAHKWADRVYTPEDFWLTQPDPEEEYDVVFEASGELTNVTRIIPRCGANSRIVLLARSGTPLELNLIDRVITNAIIIRGSRGHLGGAFGKLIRLCEAGRLPLHEVVTNEITGLESLKKILLEPEQLTADNAKILVLLDQIK